MEQGGLNLVRMPLQSKIGFTLVNGLRRTEVYIRKAPVKECSTVAVVPPAFLPVGDFLRSQTRKGMSDLKRREELSFQSCVSFYTAYKHAYQHIWAAVLSRTVWFVFDEVYTIFLGNPRVTEALMIC